MIFIHSYHPVLQAWRKNCHRDQNIGRSCWKTGAPLKGIYWLTGKKGVLREEMWAKCFVCFLFQSNSCNLCSRMHWCFYKTKSLHKSLFFWFLSPVHNELTFLLRLITKLCFKRSVQNALIWGFMKADWQLTDADVFIRLFGSPPCVADLTGQTPSGLYDWSFN